MKTIENLHSMCTENREAYFSMLNGLKANVRTLETIYGETIGSTPADTIKKFVDAVGYDDAVVAVATLVNRSAWDGRISRRAADWAASIENSLDETAAIEHGIYTNRIHCAHLDQLAGAMMKFSPEPAPIETPDEPTERPAAISIDAAPAVQLDTFQQQFTKEYEFLYAARDNVAGYQEAVKAFDEYAASADGAAFVGAFVKHRGDFISSDREAAAFMFALEALEAAKETQDAAPTFTAHAVTMPNGETFPAAWHIYAGNAIADLDLGNGKRAEITIDDASPYYISALCAAQEAERIAQAEAEAEKERQRAERRAARAADPAKQAHGPIPEKTWAGQKIKGLGYMIDFSVTYDRVMIHFDGVPTDAARAIVKEAGFYWAPTLKAWVKGLNWKAYRAALKVQDAFTTLKEAPSKPRRAA